MIVYLKNYPIEVIITKYIAPVEGVVSDLPENCYPDEPAELLFDVDTGNNLLDEIIEGSEEFMGILKEQILEKLQDVAT